MADSAWVCSRCGSDKTRVRILKGSVHHWQEKCAGCGKWIKFLPRPDNLKPKREKSHTELVEAYSKGFCEICLILKEQIPNGESLHAHHVIEYRDGGTSDRDNIEIVCTACHKLIHWVRTYRHHIAPEKYYAVECPTGTEGEKAVGQLEDGPPWGEGDQGTIPA